MSNWDYANEVPTKKWKSAMSIPRELKLLKENDGFQVITSLIFPEEVIVDLFINNYAKDLIIDKLDLFK